MASASYDPHLGAGPSDDSVILLDDDSDSGSLLSDDSVLPDYERDEKHTEPAKSLYEACARNEPASLRRIMERGVTKEEANELDINGRVSSVTFGTFLQRKGVHVCYEGAFIPALFPLRMD